LEVSSILLVSDIAMKYLLPTGMGSFWGPLISPNKNLAQKMKKIAWKNTNYEQAITYSYILVVYILILHRKDETKEHSALIDSKSYLSI